MAVGSHVCIALEKRHKYTFPVLYCEKKSKINTNRCYCGKVYDAIIRPSNRELFFLTSNWKKYAFTIRIYICPNSMTTKKNGLTFTIFIYGNGNVFQ